MKFHVDIRQSKERTQTPALPRRPLPFLSSPVDVQLTVDTQEDGPTEKEKKVPFSKTRLPTTTVTSRRAVVFKPRHESTAIELFYDLFFVANLTIFTENNEIEDAASMASYLGFFTLIWFTWLQVSLFDVRFATETFFNRLSKSVALVVMGLFALAGPDYDTSDVEHSTSGFQFMCVAMAIQRFALAGQYGVTMWFVRQHRKAVVPILLTIFSLLITGAIFLALRWSFHEGTNIHSYVGLYVVSLVEAVAVVAVSCAFKTIDYRHTNLVERFGLLTLIILGEGVIGAVRSISTALLNTDIIKGTFVALAFAALLLIYAIWILYFDQIEHDRFGSIRQQIWALLHFPLHLALILTLQGISRFVVWGVLVDVNNYFVDYFNEPLNYHSAGVYVAQLKENLTTFDQHFKTKQFIAYYNYTEDLSVLSTLNWNTSQGGKIEAEEIYAKILVAANNFLFYNFDVHIHASGGAHATPFEQLDDAAIIFEDAWIYFLVGAGFVLQILGLMYWFGKRRKILFERAGVVLRLLVGAGLALLAIASLSAWGDDVLENSWTIPLVLLVYCAVIFVDDIMIWLSYRRGTNRVKPKRKPIRTNRLTRPEPAKQGGRPVLA